MTSESMINLINTLLGLDETYIITDTWIKPIHSDSTCEIEIKMVKK